MSASWKTAALEACAAAQAEDHADFSPISTSDDEAADAQAKMTYIPYHEPPKGKK